MPELPMIHLNPECPLTVEQLQGLVLQLQDDAGAIYSKEGLASLQYLRQQDPAAFARIRQQVKETKRVSMGDFDRLTVQQEETSPRNGELFEAVTPWPEPVDGAQLLHELTEAFSRFVIADIETLQGAALWSVFTWVLDAVQVAPIANITAPEKRCGKTVLLSALGKVTCRPVQSSGVSPSALFRAIELWQPTLLIDEVDTFLRDNEGARGILNAGFTRDSAFIIRCVGDEHIPTKFNVWGAKALCGIGKIADTLSDRSIPLRLRRKLPHEQVEHLRHAEPGLWETLRQKIARFVEDNRLQIASERPLLIDGLNDRANDCWEPLLQVAAVAGGDWPSLARRAALTLHGVEDQAPSVGVELLTDIQTLFDHMGTGKLFTTELLEGLINDEEAPWGSWNRGKPMTLRQLSTKLKEFGIKSKQIRIGPVTKKGIDRSDFADAFGRYLSPPTPHTPALSETAKQSSSDAACSHFAKETPTPHISDEKQLQPSHHAGCFDVSHKKPPLQPNEPAKDTKTFWGNSSMGGRAEHPQTLNPEVARAVVSTGEEIKFGAVIHRTAHLLNTTPKDLIARGFIDRDEITELLEAKPEEVVKLIKSNPNWRPINGFWKRNEGYESPPHRAP